MANLWAARFSKELDAAVNDFNSSIKVDGLMYKEDIEGSIAHAKMLGATGIISAEDADAIVKELNAIRDEITAGVLVIDPEAEDIHMFVEGELTKRLPEAGKRLHTARSRNDQVAVDARLYLRAKTDEIRSALRSLVSALYETAEKNVSTVMPGYTHLQRAQPVTFAHHLAAYCAMFMRDDGRLADCRKRMNYSPLGSGALAGTTYPIDRKMTAKLLGFDGVTFNSTDGVSDRDYQVELASAIALVMTHLSRLSEEIILWCSWEFRFVELDDAYSTGSSIMPQKKNPDIAELVRGKTGRVYGDLVTLLTMLKGLPLAYNKDMQEDKEAIFDAAETVISCLKLFAPMISTMKVNADNMANAALKGYINATDLADYLVRKGLPFRSAYKVSGTLVAKCVAKGIALNDLTLDELKEQSPLFGEDVYEAISLDTCLNKRTSEGAPSAASVAVQLGLIKEFLDER